MKWGCSSLKKRARGNPVGAHNLTQQYFDISSRAIICEETKKVTIGKFQVLLFATAHEEARSGNSRRMHIRERHPTDACNHARRRLCSLTSYMCQLARTLCINVPRKDQSHGCLLLPGNYPRWLLPHVGLGFSRHRKIEFGKVLLQCSTFLLLNLQLFGLIGVNC